MVPLQIANGLSTLFSDSEDTIHTNCPNDATLAMANIKAEPINEHETGDFVSSGAENQSNVYLSGQQKDLKSNQLV